MENFERNEEIACNKQFLLFSQCFLPTMALILHFKRTLKCRLQFVSIWTSLKLCGMVMGFMSRSKFLASPTILNNIRSLVPKLFLHLETFESNYFWLAKPYSLANQMLRYFQLSKIFEKKTKDNLENGRLSFDGVFPLIRL